MDLSGNPIAGNANEYMKLETDSVTGRRTLTALKPGGTAVLKYRVLDEAYVDVERTPVAGTETFYIDPDGLENQAALTVRTTQDVSGCSIYAEGEIVGCIGDEPIELNGSASPASAWVEDAAGAWIPTTVQWRIRYTGRNNITISQDGKLAFVAAGTNEIRAEWGGLSSDWLPVTAKESQRLASLSLSDPNGLLSDCLVSSESSTRTYDLDLLRLICVDQYGDEMAPPEDISWTVARNGVEKVIEDPHAFSATESGAYILRAKAGTVSSNALTLSFAPRVTGIRLNIDNCTMSVGETVRLASTALPEGEEDTFTYKSSRPDIASVAADGTVSANQAGTSVVTVASRSNPQARAQCSVTVVDPPEYLTVSPSEMLVTIGGTGILNAKVTPVGTPATITYTSGDESVAMVDPSGRVTGISLGTTFIRAETHNQKAGFCTVRVVSEPTGIDAPGALVLNEGGTYSLAGQVKLRTRGLSLINYQSTDPDIVSVDEYGTVTAVRRGETAIIVTGPGGIVRLICIAVIEPDSGDGTADAPWLIGTAERWELFADTIRNGLDTEGKHFRLTDDISVATMIGTERNPFRGSFDGDGHKLNVNLTSCEPYAAPFRCVSGASFARLRIAGTINTASSDAAGLVGYAKGPCSVTDCVSDIHIVASASGGHAGFVSYCDSDDNVSVTGSLFTGSISGENATYSAGFIGWAGWKTDDCVYDGDLSGGGGNSNTFIRSRNYANNCYWLNAEGVERVKGKQGLAVTADEGITIDFGAPTTTYPTSDITAYKTGLMYNGEFYAGEGERVSLGLSAADPWEGYANSFAASVGTLAEADEGWTLTMSGEGTVISLQRAPAFATEPAVGLTADGGTDGYNSQDPDKLFDGKNNTKWCCGFNGLSWVEFHADAPALPTAYAMTTAGDAEGYLRRNPVSWRLLGKRNAGDEWTVLDTVTGCDHLPAENCVEVFFPLYNAVACQYYRLEITAVQSGNQLQIAEFNLIGMPIFGTATFTMPAALITIEESAFEGMTAMTVVDAGSVTAIGPNAFKNCTGLMQIRLPANCAIDPDAFDGCGTVYVYAPAGGTTEDFCRSNDNPCEFVEEAAD